MLTSANYLKLGDQPALPAVPHLQLLAVDGLVIAKTNYFQLELTN